MILSWKIRYFDRAADKQFKDRYLHLSTKSLDPVTRAAVELIAEDSSRKREREILKYRHLFIERSLEEDFEDPNDCDKFTSVGPDEYTEDETGKELTDQELAYLLTGSPTARFIPRGARQHDLDLMLAEPKPMPIAEVSLDPEEVRLLGYFVRDLQEMRGSAFMKESPGTLSTSGSPMLSPTGNPTLQTAATDDEIRSFVTIFRRLYMTGKQDPASFVKVVPIFVKAMNGHPYGKWTEEVRKEYQNHLDAVPEFRPFIQPGTCTFSTKLLIDVFLYTQYAHQPDEKREKQFVQCLGEVSGKRAVLTWMFLTEIWKCSLKISNAGKVISWWFKRYCDHHGVSPNVLNSLRDDHSGLGATEKEEDRRARLFREKTEELAVELWKQHGRPEGGPMQFLVTARDQLSRRLSG